MVIQRMTNVAHKIQGAIMVEKNKKVSFGISNVVISGAINFVIFYFFISLYDIFINNEPIVSGPRILVSLFAVVCIYFLSNGYYSAFNNTMKFISKKLHK